jgi:hypothetical protein
MKIYLFAGACAFVFFGCGSDEPQCRIPCPFHMDELCWEDCTQAPPGTP